MSLIYTEIAQEVEAMQFLDAETGLEIIKWTGDVDVRMVVEAKDEETIRVLFLNTPAGTVTVEETDWVIKREEGYFTCFNNDHFTTNYKKKD